MTQNTSRQPHAQYEVAQKAAATRGATAAPDPHVRVAIPRVRELCGGVSEMSIWRWQNDPELSFPQPVYIGRRRYWREADVIAWLDARAEKTAA